MNMKVYKKTRYNNIYKHIKNGNYAIAVSKPFKTSVSEIDDKKIFSIDEAIKFRDSYAIKTKKTNSSSFSDDFDTLWNKYIDDCKYNQKLAYNTLLEKEKAYNKYLKEKISKKISKTDKLFWSKFISSLDTTDKQKNEVLKQIKCVFNWAVYNNLIVFNPVDKINSYKVETEEMKFWSEEDILKFIKTINEDIYSDNYNRKRIGYMIKIITYFGFCTGQRIGEIRALTFNSFNYQENKLLINHSINYDRKSKNHLVAPKTSKSKRELIINEKLIELVKEYKDFLEIELNIKLNNTGILLFNYSNNMPYSDTALRKHFYKYIEKADVPKIRMYDLRHSYATNMLLHDVPLKYISNDMGHSSIQITGDIYSHVVEKKRKEIAKITDDLFI